jgi:hypothetical protein
MAEPCGAEILVRNPRTQGVTHVFGVPGAKIDRVYDSGPVIIEVPVDYSHNRELGHRVRADEIV